MKAVGTPAAWVGQVVAVCLVLLIVLTLLLSIPARLLYALVDTTFQRCRGWLPDWLVSVYPEADD